MNYYTFSPPESLSQIVVHYWTLNGIVGSDQQYVHRTLANFCPELIFHYGERFDELSDNDGIVKTFISGIHGQTDRIRRFTAKDNYGIFSVILQPYAIPLLFGISSLEVKNGLVDLASLIGQSGKDITDRMLLAKNNIERVQIVNRFFFERLRKIPRPEIVKAIHEIYRLNGIVNIKSIAEQSTFSQRQFERNFKDHAGFSPKSFSRLVRFKTLVNNHKKEYSNLTQAAYEYGYYDQAHFIQDFVQFSGYNPNTYFSGKASEVFYAP